MPGLWDNSRKGEAGRSPIPGTRYPMIGNLKSWSFRSWHTNSVRNGVHPTIADAILGHGDRKKSLQSLYMTISDEDLIRAIDMMRCDIGETEIWVKK